MWGKFINFLEFLITAKLNNFSISALFIMSGTEIKKGIFLNKPIKLIDVSPTLSEILEIPNP